MKQISANVPFPFIYSARIIVASEYLLNHSNRKQFVS